MNPVELDHNLIQNEWIPRVGEVERVWPSLLTLGFAHGDGLYEVQRGHEELTLVLHRAEHPEPVLMGGHVHIPVIQVIRLGLEKQANTQRQTHTQA